MDKQHIKGALDKAKGAVKEAVGDATRNPRLKTAGKVDKVKGAVRGAVGDVKDALKGRRI